MKKFLSALRRTDERHHRTGVLARRCGFECLEPRQMLAADLALGTSDVSLGHTDGSTGSIGGSISSAVSAANCGAHAASESLADVLVQLLDETGAVIEESRTDAAGQYHFDDLIPGQYAIRQIAQVGPLEGALLETSSHVGDGGGIAFESNLVSEIVVRAGETLGGYDFCNFSGGPTPTGPVDRPIVPHDHGGTVLPILALSLQSTLATQSDIFAEQVVEPTAGAKFAVPAPLSAERSEPLFGGSSRSIKSEQEGLKALDDDPFDSLFSTVDFFEIAATELPTLETFEPILQESFLDESYESSDSPNADAYTTSTIEWCEDDASINLGEVLGDTEIISVEISVAEVDVPKIAQRHDAR